MTSGSAEERPSAHTAAQFATTHWSVVLAAGDSASPESVASLERLCRTYWYPLYAFVRRKGYDPEDAKDLTQAFFERFLEKHFLKQVAPERGRFRTFLLTAVTHFLANEWDRVKAAKRGGQFTFIPLDAATIEERYRIDDSPQESPEHRFDRLWAEDIMDRALDLLEEEHRASDKSAQFEALASFLSRSPDAGEYAALGARLGLTSHAIAVAVTRLRERYRALIRAEVRQTVNTAAEIEAEMRYLVELMSE
jgi:DNA-directed RNA polymerase specialized sigma24 family protein